MAEWVKRGGILSGGLWFVSGTGRLFSLAGSIGSNGFLGPHWALLPFSARRVLGCGFLAPAAFFGLWLFLFRLRWRGSRSRQWSSALDAKFECARDVLVQPQLNLVFTQGADWMIEVDFPFIKRHIKLRLELVGDHSISDRAEHFTIFTGFDADNANQF